MTDFDLRALARDVLAEGGCSTFREYADKLLDRIPRARYREALQVTLTEFIRECDHRPAVVVPTRGEHASRKVAAIAGAWQQMLARHIATEDGFQVRLADATLDQVRFYAGLLRVKAAEVAAQAQTFDRIADLMESEGAARVAQLPPHVAGPVMGRAA